MSHRDDFDELDRLIAEGPLGLERPGIFRRMGEENVAAGPPTEEEFLRTMGKMMEPKVPTPDMIITSAATIERARDSATQAMGAAHQLWRLADELPWWAWRRRRSLRVAGIEQARIAEGLWATFGVRP